MFLVGAMAIQNATHPSWRAPAILMTGVTTQIVVDLADLSAGSKALNERSEIRARLPETAAALGLFAADCAAAALLYAAAQVWCFAIPRPALGALAVFANQHQRTAGA